MAVRGEIESFDAVAPEVIARSSGGQAAAAEMHETARAVRPNVLLVLSPKGLGHDVPFVAELVHSAGNPVVLYWEGDPWHRWVKRPNASMHAWLGAADVVFATARQPETALFRRAGARDVRFIPNTYCHVQFADAEKMDHPEGGEIKYDAVLIGSRFAHLGLIFESPYGAAQRTPWCGDSSGVIVGLLPTATAGEGRRPCHLCHTTASLGNPRRADVRRLG